MLLAKKKKELKNYIITSISTEDTKLININVADRILTETYNELNKELENLRNTIEKLEANVALINATKD